VDLTPESIVGLALAGAAAVGTGIKLAWSYMTSLVDRFQVESVQCRKDFLQETVAARREFLEGLRDIERQCQEHRSASDARVQETLADVRETLASLTATLRERGMSTASTGDKPHA
jgi:hypothetical protein